MKYTVLIWNGHVSHPTGDLVNIKSERFLFHSNHHIFKIIILLESSFKKHAHFPSIFEETHKD